MRRHARAFCLLTAIALGVGHTAAAQEPALIKEQLADGVYLLRAPEALDRWTATNAVVVINQDDVTVFDSFTRPATARMAIAEIRALTPKPVRTLINSHWHQDHWSGNDEFKKAFPGIQIIASDETRAYMTRMGSEFLIDGTRAGLRRSPPGVAGSPARARWRMSSSSTAAAPGHPRGSPGRRR